MTDERFIRVINGIAREHRLQLPALRPHEAPSPAFVSDWARFLELAVKEGVALSDLRWLRLSIQSEAPYTRFALESGEDGEEDADFRVGLQLLMGMLDDEEGPADAAENPDRTS